MGTEKSAAHVEEIQGQKYTADEPENKEIETIFEQTVHTEDFTKAVLSGAWLFESMREMVLKKKSFRTEIRYNAEAGKVVIETSAPKESLQDGSRQEC